MSIGDKPSGETGVLLRSRDFGVTWQRMDRLLGELREIAWQAVPRSEPGLSENL